MTYTSLKVWLLVLLSFNYSCKKDELSRSNPYDLDGAASTLPVLTNGMLTFSDGTVYFYSEVLADGGLPVEERGVCYNFSGNPSLAFYKAKSGAGVGPYQCEIPGLLSGFTYYFRAYAISARGVSYGAELSIRIP